MSNDSSKPSTAKNAQYGSVTWGPVRGLLMVAGSFVLGQVLAVGAIIVLALLAQQWLSVEGEGWVDEPVGQFLLALLVSGLTLGALAFFLRKRRATWPSLGFTRGPKPLDPAYALLGWAAYFIILITVIALFGSALDVDLDEKQDIGFESITTNVDLIFAFITLVILPPIIEEVLFRGVLFGGLRKRLSFVWSTLITSVIFGALHLMGGAEGSGALWVAGIDTLLLSFVLCYLREYTGSLWASIGLHMIKNAIAYLSIFILVL